MEETIRQRTSRFHVDFGSARFTVTATNDDDVFLVVKEEESLPFDALVEQVERRVERYQR